MEYKLRSIQGSNRTSLCYKKRRSIDIPITNNDQLFLKTRMEASEEEKIYIRRKHLDNSN